jgi:carboxylate-amine ligase
VSFGGSAPWSVGVEEELFLVDARTLETAPLFSEVVPEPGPRLKPELFACIVEITTPICTDAEGVLEELQQLRREVAARAGSHGATILAAATHPLARAVGQPIVPKQRYLDLLARIGDRVRLQLVCGLHVHVGVPSADTCLRALEGALPWLPVLLSMSANSPFVEGEDSGLLSARAGRLEELPSGGPPPVLRSWSDWEAVTGEDYTRLLWDARPHPRFGTLEVRITDQQTDVRRSAGFAALVQALVVSVVDHQHEAYDRDLYAERRVRAAAAPPDPDDLAALAALVEPAARKLGSWALVRALLGGRPEAEQQLELGLPAAVRDIAERSLG